jgi:hypothetical protein
LGQSIFEMFEEKANYPARKVIDKDGAVEAAGKRE